MTYFDYNVSITLDIVLKSDNANCQVIGVFLLSDTTIYLAMILSLKKKNTLFSILFTVYVKIILPSYRQIFALYTRLNAILICFYVPLSNPSILQVTSIAGQK
jgi:hypothetical protein